MQKMILDIHLDNDIQAWLQEDVPYWDVSYPIGDDSIVEAEIIAKDSGVIAGMRVAARILKLLDIEHISSLDDGDKVSKGDVILTCGGRAENILRAERVLLNIVSHMSGIATRTRQFKDIVESSNNHARIAATRKTLPGLRKYQKWEVIIGGGDTHRLDLSSMALIKENHIEAAGSVTNAISSIKHSISFSHKIEIEVTNEEEAIEAVEAGVDIIMLDNFVPSKIKEIIPKLREKDPKILIEASGGINEETLTSFLETGVDIISLGMLTHSVQAFDLSLMVKD